LSESIQASKTVEVFSVLNVSDYTSEMDMQFKIGCSGFYNRQWKGIFYPEKLPQSKWLNFYCEYFNTLELNSTFYQFPKSETLHTWYKKSPDGFVFSVKAPKMITHMKKFIDCQRLIEDFYSACELGLENKLGCILFQLPPSIVYDEEKLELIINLLNPVFKNVIEFRHKSWWSKKVYDHLTEKGITFCSVSHPTLPDTVIANTSLAYIRLHGTPRMFYSDYSTPQLEQLRQSIFRKKKVKEAFVYFNNTASTAGVLNAQQLQKMIH